MSMCICDSCSRSVDSDDDPDCFIDTSPTTTACLCEWCREENEEETESAPGRDSQHRAVKGQEPEVHRAVLAPAPEETTNHMSNERR